MNTTPLFRTEAIEAERSESLGTIRLATPLSTRTAAIVALVVGIGMIAFGVFAHYTRREHVTGLLLPTGGLLEIGAPSSGVVLKLYVSQGMDVLDGTPLISLSGERSSSAFGETDKAIERQLTLEKGRYQQDLFNLNRMQEEQSEALTRRIELTSKQISGLDVSKAALDEQAAMATSLVEKIKPLLQKGYVSEMQFQQQRSNVLQLKEAIKTAEGQKLALEAQAVDLNEQLTRLPLGLAAQRNDFERKISDIDKQLAENEAQRDGFIKANRRARVSMLLVNPGQTVVAGQTLLTLVPDHSPLEAALLVPSTAVGLVKKGAQVHLKYQSFPYQKYGIQTGRIASVSLSALSPDQANALTGKIFTEPMYRVDVLLDKQVVGSGESSMELRSGMSLDADIMLDKRRAIDWLFDPLYTSNHHSDEKTNKKY